MNRCKHSSAHDTDLSPSLSCQMPSSSGLPGQGKKIGHRGVDASGETTYKKVLQTTHTWAILYPLV